jgi:cell division protease FtsH
MTPGFSGADLANLLNEAALLAARHRKEAIAYDDIRQAYVRVVAGGPALKRSLTPPEKRRIAFHEAGHAVVSRHLTHADPIEKVTIVPRGRALGYVMYRPPEDKSLYTRAEIVDRMVSLLGGRAAEEVLLGEISTGAADDLERATAMARRMVTELGMSPAIGPVHTRMEPLPMLGSLASAKPMSDRMALTVDEAVRELITDSYARAMELVARHRIHLEKIAYALMEHETLDGAEVERLLAS